MFVKVAFALVACYCLLPVPADAQGLPVAISAGVNYGNFSMKDMREYQEYLHMYGSLYFGIADLKPVVSFPAQPGYEASVMASIGKWKFGVAGWRNSTGGRNDYEDYTGFLRMDVITTTNGIGIKTNYRFIDNNEHQFYATLHAGVGFNKLKVTHRLLVRDLIDEGVKSYYKSRNIIVAQGVGYRFALANRVFVTAEAKYEFNVRNGKVKTQEGDYYLVGYGEEREIRWDGYRLGLNVGYEF